MKLKQKRWMASVIATSRAELPTLPFARGKRANATRHPARAALSDLRRA
ncbi:hypothetical protein [Roseovarius spongiae]|nr:hypothetical protein [Roseovarius spongiae]